MTDMSDDTAKVGRRGFLIGGAVGAAVTAVVPRQTAFATPDPCDPTPTPTPSPTPSPTPTTGPDPAPDPGLPALVPGLAAWYKADSIEDLAEGAAVTAWPDSSGAGLTLHPAGGNAPTWHGNVQNGLSGVRFSRISSNRMTSQTFPASLPTSTCFAAFRPASATYNLRSVLLDGRTGRNSLYISTGREPSAYAGRELDDKSFDLDVNDTSAMVMTGVFANQNSVLRYMGQPLVAGNTGTMGLNGVVVGGEYAGGNPFEGDVLEVLVYNRALSPGECGQIEAYLGAKWAILGLRNERPFVPDTFTTGLVAEWQVHAEGTEVGVTGDRLRLALPGGSAHGSLGDPGQPAPRVEQAVSDGPFDIAVQWDSIPANWGEGDGHGIVVGSPSGDAIRLFNGNYPGTPYDERARLDARFGGSTSVLAEIPKKKPSPWIRLRRHGNYWTAYRSPNGAVWYRLTNAKYIPGFTAATVALAAVNDGPAKPAYTALAGEVRTVGGLDSVDVRDAVPQLIVAQSWTTDFSDGLPSWVDDVSRLGGGAVVANGRLRLSVDSVNRSRAGVAFNVRELQDCSLLVRMTFVGTGYETWLVPAILGQGEQNPDQYRPLSQGWSMEFTDKTTTTTGALLVRMHDSAPPAHSGSYDFPEPNVKTSRPAVASFWLRLERRGMRIRSRMWAHGTAEPATWSWDVQDDTIAGPGRPSIAYAFNDGTRPVGAHVYIDSLTVEELLP